MQTPHESIRYDTLVLNGNSTNAIITLGALQYIYDNRMRDAIVNMIGTSSGSIICSLLAVGYTPLELMTTICCDKLYAKVANFNFGNLILLGRGLMPFETVSNIITDMISDKIGYIPTLSELYGTTGKNLVCVTYNLTTDSKEYLSNSNHPNMPITIAVRMSSTFPFVFDPFEYDSNVYVDGGIVDNFAIDYGEKIGCRCLGVYTRNPKKPYSEDLGRISLIYKLFNALVNSLSEDKIEKCTRSDIIVVDYNHGFFYFVYSDLELIDQFDKGYDICKIFYREKLSS